MTATRDPDHLIREFLGDGHTELPDRAYDDVRAHIDHTRQRVVIGPWREDQMYRYARFVVAAAAVVLVAAIAIQLAPQSGGSAGQPGSSPTQVFASPQYPYSITMPIGWYATAASVTWHGTSAPAIDDPAVDAFGPSGRSSGRGAFGSAAPTTSTLADWVAAGIQNASNFHAECPATPDLVESVTIGGQPGTLEALNCGILIYNAYTVVDGYGYRFGFRDASIKGATDPADEATFKAMLDSVVFH